MRANSRGGLTTCRSLCGEYVSVYSYIIIRFMWRHHSRYSPPDFSCLYTSPFNHKPQFFSLKEIQFLSSETL